MANFGDRLKELRLMNNMTQTELGERVGYKRRMVQLLESNEREPNLEVIDRLCKLFRCTADYLLGTADRSYSTDHAIYIYENLPDDKKKIIDDMILKLKDPQ